MALNIFNSIKVKLLVPVLVTILFIIVAMSVVIVDEQTAIAKKQAEQNLMVLSGIVGENIQAALLFGDKEAAKQTLTSLKVKPDIIHALLLDKEDIIFVEYQKKYAGKDLHDHEELSSISSLNFNEKSSYDDEGLHYFRPIFSGEELIGVLHITDNLDSFNKQLKHFYTLVSTTSVVAFVASVILMLWLQQLFTRPLNQLIGVIKKITQSKDYSQRADIHTNDEFQDLAGHFNAMVSEVEIRGLQLQKVNEGLEQRVAERTEDLQQALELTDQASKAKSEFLAVMSHEIRTPLNGILGFAELLKLQDLGGELNEQVRSLHSSADVLLSLLNEILDFSKLDSGKLELDEEQFELADLLKVTIEHHQSTAKNKGVKLTCHDFELGYDYFIGDSLRVQQILNNLLSNAIKFTSEGAVTVDVSSRKLGSDLSVTFKISDTGIGMSDAQMLDIFSPFTQADGSITRRYGGTGLGLSICKQLVELMGGKIGAKSISGEGSTFWFTILLSPLKGIHNEAIEKDNEITEPLAESGAILVLAESGAILVAEDNPVNQLVVKGMLKTLNQDCDIVNNGVEALARARTHKYDLIFMDYHMPEMDGLLATEKIRELGSSSVNYATPIIALTADIQQSVQRKFRSAGGSGIVLKPFTRETLNNCLNQWMNKKLSKDDLPETAPTTKSNEVILSDQQLNEIGEMAGDEGSTIVNSIIDLYVQHSPELVQQISEAVANNDKSALFKAAHSLKSSSGNIGALRLEALAKNLEKDGRCDDMEQAKNRIGELEILYQNTLQALSERQRGGL